MAEAFHLPIAPHDCTGPLAWAACTHLTLNAPKANILDSEMMGGIVAALDEHGLLGAGAERTASSASALTRLTASRSAFDLPAGKVQSISTMSSLK